MSTRVIDFVEYRILYTGNSPRPHHYGYLAGTSTLCGLTRFEFDTCKDPVVDCIECNELAKPSASTDVDVDGDWFPI